MDPVPWPCNSGMSAKKILKAIINYLTDNNIDVNEIIAAGCNGTAVNIGHNGGVNQLMKDVLGKPLQ